MLQHKPHHVKDKLGHVHLEAIVVPKICTTKVRQLYRYRKEEQLKDKPIVEPVNKGREINILIASDAIIRLNNGTVAVETKVGNLDCGGQHNAPQIDSYFTTTQNTLIVTDKEHIKVPQQFFEWIQDEPDVSQTRDNLFDDFLQTSVQNLKTGHYTASLPWTTECDKSKIPTNRHIAYHRARNMIEKMSTDKQLLQKLKDIFGDYQRREFISLTTNYNYNDDKCSYVAWHAVYKDNSIHTKVWIVFDACCRDKRLGMSLNDFLWKGPNLINNLVEILLRFRLHRIAFTADIENAFL